MIKEKEVIRKIDWDKPISNDNVKDFGECLALKALKMRAIRSNGMFDNLYKSLIKDVFRPISIDRIFSDGYDVAETSILFLLHYKGKKLDDVITDRFGKKVTIRYACYHEVDRYLNKCKKDLKYTTVIDDKITDITIFNKKEDDYTECDTIISNMRLKSFEEETLNCFIAGMTYCQVARFLNVNFSTICRRRQSLQRKYLQAIKT